MNLIARLVDKLAEREVVSCDYGQSFEMICCRIVIATSVECGLHSRQISGWYWIGGVGCYSQGPSQHGEIGCQEHHEVQNSNCKVLYLDWNSALQQYRLSLSSQKAGLQKKSRGAGGQVKNRSVMPLCSKNGQSHAVQGCKGTDIPFPLSTCIWNPVSSSGLPSTRTLPHQKKVQCRAVKVGRKPMVCEEGEAEGTQCAKLWEQ